MKMCVRHNLLKSVREKGRTSHENRQRPTSIPYNKGAERPAVVPAVCTAHSLPSEKTQRGRPEKQNPPPCAQPDRQRIRRAAGQGTIYNPITILILFSDTTDLLPEGNPSCHFYA